jgi:hypothetical protein
VVKKDIKRAISLWKRRGYTALLNGVRKWVYLKMPIKPLRLHDPIEIDSVSYNIIFKHRWGKKLLIGGSYDIPTTFKQDGELHGHENLTNEGDDVIIIGGGNGVTAIHAARKVGPSGSVKVFEGGAVAKYIEQLAILNNAEDIVDVEHAVVGEAAVLYGGISNKSYIKNPSDLTNCDVLEMDCEGSELEILTKMTIRPRVIIVEVHPWYYPENSNGILQILDDLGYSIEYCSTHDGEIISVSKATKRMVANNGVIFGAMRERF